MIVTKLDIGAGPPPRAQALQPVLHVRHRGLGLEMPGLLALGLRLDGPAIRIEGLPRAVHGEVAAGGVAQPHAPVKEKALRVLENRVERIAVLTPVLPDIDAPHGHRGPGITRGGDHVHGIGEMRHPESRQTVTGLAIELPATEQPGIKGARRKVEQVRGPIHVGRDDVGDSPPPPRLVEAHGRGDAADLPEFAGGDVLRRRPEMTVAPPLGSGLHNPRPGASQVQCLASRGQVDRHRLLDIDILPGLQCGREDRPVAEVGSCNDDGIHITLLQQLAEPGELPGFVAELLRQFCRRGLARFAPDVADGGDLHVLRRRQPDQLVPVIGAATPKPIRPMPMRSLADPAARPIQGAAPSEAITEVCAERPAGSIRSCSGISWDWLHDVVIGITKGTVYRFLRDSCLIRER